MVFADSSDLYFKNINFALPFPPHPLLCITLPGLFYVNLLFYNASSSSLLFFYHVRFLLCIVTYLYTVYFL